MADTEHSVSNGNRVRSLADWLPLAGAVAVGLIGWGSMNQSVGELQRRVLVLEGQQTARQDGETKVAVQLASLDANMTALRSQVADIADQLRGRRQ